MMEMEIRFDGGKKVTADYKGFMHRTDQPPEFGGEGSQPEPLDLFFVSLATCTAYTVLSFCQSRQLPTDGVRVDVHMDWDEQGKKVTAIRHEIHLPAAFPEKYKKAIIRAANLCSVKRHLDDPPRIETVAVRDG
jgi:putative redox protein